MESHASTGATSSAEEQIRHRRIAALLHKAIVEYAADRAVQDRHTDTQSIPESEVRETEESDAQRVIGFLRITGEASPASIRNSLGLSRSSSFRVLQSLAHSRCIVSCGRTRNLVYRLNEQAPAPNKVALN